MPLPADSNAVSSSADNGTSSTASSSASSSATARTKQLTMSQFTRSGGSEVPAASNAASSSSAAYSLVDEINSMLQESHMDEYEAERTPPSKSSKSKSISKFGSKRFVSMSARESSGNGDSDEDVESIGDEDSEEEEEDDEDAESELIEFQTAHPEDQDALDNEESEEDEDPKSRRMVKEKKRRLKVKDDANEVERSNARLLREMERNPDVVRMLPILASAQIRRSDEEEEPRARDQDALEAERENAGEDYEDDDIDDEEAAEALDSGVNERELESMEFTDAEMDRVFAANFPHDLREVWTIEYLDKALATINRPFLNLFMRIHGSGHSWSARVVQAWVVKLAQKWNSLDEASTNVNNTILLARVNGYPDAIFTYRSDEHQPVTGGPNLVTSVRQRFEMHVKELSALREIVARSSAHNEILEKELCRISVVIHGVHQMICGSVAAANVIVAREGNVNNMAPFLFNVMNMNLNDAGSHPVAKILAFADHQIQSKNYRIYGDNIYVQIFTSDDLPTYAFQPYCTVKRFVFESCSPDLHQDMWLEMTKPNVLEKVVKMLTDPETNAKYALERSRRVWSWSNGRYFADTDRFYAYNDPSAPREPISAKYIPKPFTCTQVVGPPHKYNADETIAYDLDNKVIWTADSGEPRPPPPYNEVLKAEVLEIITKAQDWSPEVVEMLFVMLGQTLVHKTQAGLQCGPFFLGEAGTGKSTLINHWINNVYLKTDTGIIANNIERLFGMYPLRNKWLFACTEVKRNFSLDQALFNSIYTGETVVFAQKNGTPWEGVFDAHGLLAGNQVMSYADKGGSTTRRLLVFEYSKRINKATSDTNLLNKLFGELDIHIRRANLAFKYFEERRKGRDIHTPGLLPKYFTQTSESFCKDMRAAARFLFDDGTGIIRASTTDKNPRDMYIYYHHLCDVFQRWVSKQRGLSEIPDSKDLERELSEAGYPIDKTSTKPRVYGLTHVDIVKNGDYPDVLNSYPELDTSNRNRNNQQERNQEASSSEPALSSPSASSESAGNGRKRKNPSNRVKETIVDAGEDVDS